MSRSGLWSFGQVPNSNGYAEWQVSQYFTGECGNLPRARGRALGRGAACYNGCMAAAHVEYVGFTQHEKAREYTLRVRAATGDPRDFVLAIANEAFLARRVRYQDAPDLCFLKLQRELAACEGAFPDAYLKISDAELEAYRVAHTPAPHQRRPRPPQIA